MRFKYEEKGSLAVRFLSDEGGTVSMPPATWEMLGRPEDFEIVSGAIVPADPVEMPPPPDAED
jgi:hypothetical protein